MPSVMLQAAFAVALAVIPLAFTAGPAAAGAPRVAEPARHESLAIYLLKGVSAPGPVPLTLAEALAKGTVEVHETGTVSELEIENKGSEPVFVQLGDIVKGGKQDRVLTVSLVLEPASGRVPIGAYCVEQGRWAARGAEDVKRFAAAEALLPSREAKVAIAKPRPSPPPAPAGPVESRSARSPIESELNAARARDQASREARQIIEQRLVTGLPRGADGQADVWRSVGLLQRQLSANLAAPVESERSRTSLQLSLESERLKSAQAAYVAALEPAGLKDDDVIGVAVAIDGKLVSADLYPSNGLFRKMWPKIVRAAATEALAQAKASSAGGAAPPSIEAVAAFLKDAESGERSERTAGRVARIEINDADKALAVSARTPRGALVHRSYVAK